MTAEPQKETLKEKSPWLVRKGAYFIIGGALSLAAIFGLITIEQVESWLEIAGRIITVVGGPLLILAGAKTHRGSDDDTTKDDLVHASDGGATGDLDERVSDIRDRISELTGTLMDVRDRIQGATALAPAPEPDTTGAGGVYPAGR